MKILERNVYVGPSLYAHFPVIRLLLDLGALEQWPTGRLGPAYVDALVAALPSLHEHGCSYREPGGLIRRMREDDGTWLGHVLEHVAIELQNIAGEDVSFGKTRSTDTPGVYTVVYEYEQRDQGIEAGELAIKLLCSLLPKELQPTDVVPDDWEWASARDEFIRYAQRRALLMHLKERIAHAGSDRVSLAQEVLRNSHDGRIKLGRLDELLQLRVNAFDGLDGPIK